MSVETQIPNNADPNGKPSTGTPDPNNPNGTVDPNNPNGTVTPPPAPQGFDPSTMSFNPVTHQYDLTGLGDIPEGQSDSYNMVLNRFSEMGLSQEHALEILSMGMQAPQEELTPQQRLEKELPYNTKMNYSNIVGYAQGLGLSNDYLKDPAKVLLLEEVMRASGTTTTSGQPKVTDIPSNKANVETLTFEQAQAEYKNYINNSDGFTREDRIKKIDEIILKSTDKVTTKAYLDQFKN